MKVDKRKKFDEWYAANQHLPFDLQSELPVYCMADVKLLASGLYAFRQLWMEHCTFDILQKCSTLASGVITYYRMDFIRSNKGRIGVASELSYEKHKKQSSIGLKFLKWLHQEWNLGDRKIQHADEGGEYEHYYHLYPNVTDPIFAAYLGRVDFDGLLRGGISGNDRDLVIEING